MNREILIWADDKLAIEWKGQGTYLKRSYESTEGHAFSVFERVEFQSSTTVTFNYRDFFSLIGYAKVGNVLESALRVALIYPSSVYEEELYYAVKTLLNTPEPKE